MRLPWRKRDELFETNPWDEDVGLSGWVPTSPGIDLLAMMASLAKSQWTLAQWLDRLSNAQTRLSASLIFCSLMWVLVAVLNLNNVYHWW